MSNLNRDQFTTQHVPVDRLPVAGRDEHPFGISDHDEPAEYLKGDESGGWAKTFGKTYSLQHVPLESLHPDHLHNASCYVPTPENESRHDVDPEPGYDVDYVRRMAKDVDKLPALVATRQGHYFGGGHRTAAYAEAGRKTIPMWVPDDAP